MSTSDPLPASLADLLVYSAEVQAALAAGKPIVALESTIITHGMPFPQNVETARQVEADIREAGAVPATIAVLDGRIRIGLDAADLDRLGQEKNVMKCSRADLAIAVTTGRPGSTTVAATMMAADAAGISVFATGGIGGVHKGLKPASISPPIWTNFPARRSALSAPGPRPCSTFRRRWKCWKRAACRLSLMARTKYLPSGRVRADCLPLTGWTALRKSPA